MFRWQKIPAAVRLFYFENLTHHSVILENTACFLTPYLQLAALSSVILSHAVQIFTKCLVCLLQRDIRVDAVRSLFVVLETLAYKGVL